MSTAPQKSAGGKILTPAMIAALVGVLALAVVTVIVVVNNNDASPSAKASSSKSGSKAAKKADPNDPNTVTSSTYGVLYTKAADGYDSDKWQGPSTFSVGGNSLSDAVAYEACKPDAGTDLLYGLKSSSEKDLAKAAESALTDVGSALWGNGSESDITNKAAPEEKQTSGGITGQLTEADVTRPGGADPCGTTGSHVATFAFKTKNDSTAVMVVAYRNDGDTHRTADEMLDDAIATLNSLTPQDA